VSNITPGTANECEVSCPGCYPVEAKCHSKALVTERSGRSLIFLLENHHSRGGQTIEIAFRHDYCGLIELRNCYGVHLGASKLVSPITRRGHPSEVSVFHNESSFHLYEKRPVSSDGRSFILLFLRKLFMVC